MVEKTSMIQAVRTKKDINILLVDDKPENLLALEAMLEAPNRRFIKVMGGNEALKYVIKHPDIGLIILDVQMPDMDGFEVASILQSNPRTKDISIIFVTAISKEEHHVLRGFEDGAVDYLAKPLDVNLTRAKVAVFERLYFYQAGLRAALEEKRAINEQLERFMYVVAHDLKAPLSGISSLLSLVKEGLQDMEAAELKSYVSLCERSSLKLSYMISSILNHSKTSDFSSDEELINLREMLEELRDYLFLPAHVHYVVKDNLPSFYTSKIKLQQVFQNLITNAIKHNDKAVVFVEVGLDKEDAECYTFYVKDNGKGIHKDDQTRVFNVFETLDNAVSERPENTGVGLNIAKMFVEKQGGTIEVESELGKGSTFYFTWRK